MLCISRITDEKLAQRFGDGRHNFHIEMRCNLPCMSNLDICEKCVGKTPTYKTHGSRKFDHGKVNEPIPDNSHIFGGSWYEKRIKEWGAPTSESIQYALKHQEEARCGYFVSSNVSSSGHKDIKQQRGVEMPRGRKPKAVEEGQEGQENITPVKRKRPNVASCAHLDSANDSLSPPQTDKALSPPSPLPSDEKPKITVRRRKADLTQDSPGGTEKKKPVSPRKKVSTASATSSSPITNALLSGEEPIVFQEAVIPTIMESTIEQVDTDGYEIEYVELREFEVGGATYYRDSKKNKLYKKVKNGIGPYVGRYSQEMGEIDNSIHDSDDEN